MTGTGGRVSSLSLDLGSGSICDDDDDGDDENEGDADDGNDGLDMALLSISACKGATESEPDGTG